jgi:lipoate---protein ligase
MATWRLIPPICASGRFQMALDRWLFEQHSAGNHPPTLRFYTWQPAAISLGYHQRTIPQHWHHLTWNHAPVELVQRPTGGRAVLHQGDLTYAVIMSGVASSRIAAYQKVCEFLIQGWRSLGVELQYGDAGRGYIHNPDCFGTATTADLVLSNGFKLIGSAQLRQGNTILQHGSIRLTPDAHLFKMVFGESVSFPELPSAIQTLANQGQQGQEQLAQSFTQAAQTCFDATFQIQPLSKQEQQAIDLVASL